MSKQRTEFHKKLKSEGKKTASKLGNLSSFHKDIIVTPVGLGKEFLLNANANAKLEILTFILNLVKLMKFCYGHGNKHMSSLFQQFSQ